MTSLRVLQINSRLTGGGTDTQNIELCRGLHALGDEVTVALVAGRRWEPLVRATGLAVETLPSPTWLKVGFIRRLGQLIRERRAQIVHVHHGRDYWPTIIAARLAGGSVRVVISRHLMTVPRRVSRRWLLSFADVVAVSKAVRRVLEINLRGPQSRIHLVYGSIDTDLFQPGRSAAALEFRRQQGWEPQHVVFAIVGNCHLPRGKGQLVFLTAAAQLKDKFPQARFMTVGRGDMEPVLHQRVVELGLQGVASILPFSNDIPTIMQAIDVLALPTVRAEALGVVLWEAMACGKPVIGSRLDGIPEAFVEGQHGLLIPPGDAAALGAAMQAFLTDPTLRERYGASAREWVCTNASLARQAREMHNLYERLLAQS